MMFSIRATDALYNGFVVQQDRCTTVSLEARTHPAQKSSEINKIDSLGAQGVPQADEFRAGVQRSSRQGTGWSSATDAGRDVHCREPTRTELSQAGFRARR